MTLKINTTDAKDLLDVLKKLDEAGLIDRAEQDNALDKLLSDPDTFKIHPVPFPTYPYNPDITCPIPKRDYIVITCTSAVWDGNSLVIPNGSTFSGVGI